MSFFDLLRMSLSSLWRRKLRTFLTVLGVLIGTTSIVAMLSLALGMKAMIMSEYASMGNIKQINVTADSGYSSSSKIDMTKLLTDTNLKSMSKLAHVTSATPVLDLSISMKSGKYSGWSELYGVDESVIKSQKLGKGSYPDSSSGQLQILAGNGIITNFSYMSGENSIDYYSTGELPDVDLMKDVRQLIYSGDYSSSDSSSTVTDDTQMDTASANTGSGTGGTSGTTTKLYSGAESSGTNYSSTSGTTTADSGSAVSKDAGTSAGTTSGNTTGSDKTNSGTGTSGSTDSTNTSASSSVSTDTSDTSAISSDTTSSNLVIRAKITGIMDGTPDDYTTYSQYLLTDIDALKGYLVHSFGKANIPGQPKRNGKPLNEWVYNSFVITVDNIDNVEEVQREIQDLGFTAQSNKEALESGQKTIQIIELVMGGIGMIAFLVAAIGIANTMMMSIYERTKEIGVMKVLGCDIRDIRKMFLGEAGFIGFIGGVIGLGFSFGISCIINNFAAASGEMSGNISMIPWWLAIVAVAFSTLMGMLAGYFPAKRAMKLSPLAAIHTE